MGNSARVWLETIGPSESGQKGGKLPPSDSCIGRDVAYPQTETMATERSPNNDDGENCCVSLFAGTLESPLLVLSFVCFSCICVFSIFLLFLLSYPISRAAHFFCVVSCCFSHVMFFLHCSATLHVCFVLCGRVATRNCARRAASLT